VDGLMIGDLHLPGDWFSTFTQHSDATTVDGGHDLYPNVTWQWEHKTGALVAVGRDGKG